MVEYTDQQKAALNKAVEYYNELMNPDVLNIIKKESNGWIRTVDYTSIGKLQDMLADLGYYNRNFIGDIPVIGDIIPNDRNEYDSDLQEAVKNFQQATGLTPADGKMYEATMQRIIHSWMQKNGVEKGLYEIPGFQENKFTLLNKPYKDNEVGYTADNASQVPFKDGYRPVTQNATTPAPAAGGTAPAKPVDDAAITEIGKIYDALRGNDNFRTALVSYNDALHYNLSRANYVGVTYEVPNPLKGILTLPQLDNKNGTLSSGASRFATSGQQIDDLLRKAAEQKGINVPLFSGDENASSPSAAHAKVIGEIKADAQKYGHTNIGTGYLLTPETLEVTFDAALRQAGATQEQIDAFWQSKNHQFATSGVAAPATTAPAQGPVTQPAAKTAATPAGTPKPANPPAPTTTTTTPPGTAPVVGAVSVSNPEKPKTNVYGGTDGIRPASDFKNAYMMLMANGGAGMAEFNRVMRANIAKNAGEDLDYVRNETMAGAVDDMLSSVAPLTKSFAQSFEYKGSQYKSKMPAEDTSKAIAGLQASVAARAKDGGWDFKVTKSGELDANTVRELTYGAMIASGYTNEQVKGALDAWQAEAAKTTAPAATVAAAPQNEPAKSTAKPAKPAAPATAKPAPATAEKPGEKKPEAAAAPKPVETKPTAETKPAAAPTKTRRNNTVPVELANGYEAAVLNHLRLGKVVEPLSYSKDAPIPADAIVTLQQRVWAAGKMDGKNGDNEYYKVAKPEDRIVNGKFRETDRAALGRFLDDHPEIKVPEFKEAKTPDEALRAFLANGNAVAAVNTAYKEYADKALPGERFNQVAARYATEAEKVRAQKPDTQTAPTAPAAAPAATASAPKPVAPPAATAPATGNVASIGIGSFGVTAPSDLGQRPAATPAPAAAAVKLAALDPKKLLDYTDGNNDPKLQDQAIALLKRAGLTVNEHPNFTKREVITNALEPLVFEYNRTHPNAGLIASSPNIAAAWNNLAPIVDARVAAAPVVAAPAAKAAAPQPVAPSTATVGTTLSNDTAAARRAQPGAAESERLTAAAMDVAANRPVVSAPNGLDVAAARSAAAGLPKPDVTTLPPAPPVVTPASAPASTAIDVAVAMKLLQDLVLSEPDALTVTQSGDADRINGYRKVLQQLTGQLRAVLPPEDSKALFDNVDPKKSQNMQDVQSAVEDGLEAFIKANPALAKTLKVKSDADLPKDYYTILLTELETQAKTAIAKTIASPAVTVAAVDNALKQTNVEISPQAADGVSKVVSSVVEADASAPLPAAAPVPGGVKGAPQNALEEIQRRLNYTPESSENVKTLYKEALADRMAQDVFDTIKGLEDQGVTKPAKSKAQERVEKATTVIGAESVLKTGSGILGAIGIGKKRVAPGGTSISLEEASDALADLNVNKSAKEVQASIQAIMGGERASKEYKDKRVTLQELSALFVKEVPVKTLEQEVSQLKPSDTYSDAKSVIDAGVKAMLAKFDSNSDQLVSNDEFARVVEQLRNQGVNIQDMQSAFSNAVVSGNTAGLNQTQLSELAAKDENFNRAVAALAGVKGGTNVAAPGVATGGNAGRTTGAETGR